MLPLKGLLPSSTAQPHPSYPIPAQPPTPEIRPWVCLQGSQGTLVAEQIQVSSLNPQTPMVWLRPVLLQWQGQIWDLSASPDLLWPAAACRPAYVEEVMPWWQQARPADPQQRLLQQFLQHLWARSGDREHPP